MKKIFAIFLAVCLLATLAGCGTSGPEQEKTDSLTIYTTVSDTTVETIVGEFEAKTGIKVELVTGGVGELLKRIESERDNPLGDLIWGAALSSIQAYDVGLFEPYVSENNDAIYQQYQVDGGVYSVYGVAMRCLLVNTNLVGDMEITGYQSLLQDGLRRWTKGYTIKQPNMDCQPTEITALMRHRAVFS